MYYLILWDTDLAANSIDGALNKVEIPIDLANFFFRLDSSAFPILSSLSFSDYDLFSDEQLDLLTSELHQVANVNAAALASIQSMIKIISDAKSLGKHVLFDPFRSLRQ